MQITIECDLSIYLPIFLPIYLIYVCICMYVYIYIHMYHRCYCCYYYSYLHMLFQVSPINALNGQTTSECITRGLWLLEDSHVLLCESVYSSESTVSCWWCYLLPAFYLRDTAGYLISCSRWEGHSYHKPTNKQNGRTRPPHQYCQQAW